MDNAHARERRPSFRPHAAYVVAMVVFAAVFAFLALSEFHAPTPHGLPVGVVAPASVTKQVEAGLGHAVPGGFDVQVYPDQASATVALDHGVVDGALIDSTGHPQLLLAQAQGTAPSQAVTSAFTAFAAKTGHTLTVTDAVPPRPDDSLALSPFFVVLAVLLPSMAAGSASALLFRRARPAWAVAAPVVAAVGMGAVGAGIADGIAGLGDYPALAGILALFSVAVSVPTAVLSRIKPPLAALALLVMVVLGIPDSGGPGGLAPFSPRALRDLHSALPVGLASDVIRRVVYFGGYGTTNALWVLGAWAGGGLVALALVTMWRQAKARSAAMPVAALADGAAPAVSAAVGAPILESRVSQSSADGRPAGPGGPGGIVVGFDNSVGARRALGQAARLASATHEVLHVVYADHAIFESDLSGFAHAEMQKARDEEAVAVAEAAAEISASLGVPHTFERSRSAAADAILYAATALADHGESQPVIVVGRSGHSGSHLLGGVPTHLLAHSSFPVLAIP